MLISSANPASATSIDQLGGKGYNLVRLQEHDIPVPPWYAIPPEWLSQAIDENGLRPQLAAVEAGEGDLAALRETISACTLPAALVAELRERHHSLFGNQTMVSVRSSAADEDAGTASFAGLHDSFLFVPDVEAVLQHVARVWASAYNERAISFRRENGLPVGGIRIAVIVQQMVEAECCGIMFTANPNSGNVQEILISACYGAGEGIVSAGLPADLYTVAKRDLTFTTELAVKEEQLCLDRAAGHGLISGSVPESRRETPALTEQQVREVATIGLRIERIFERPQDIEFSIDQAGRLYLLQSRAITTIREVGPAAGNRIIWDNSNIIESYSGPTSPMTFSFIRHAYTIVYHCFAEVMGVPPTAVRRHRHVFANMLGLFHGQVYYNLANWYRLVRLFPGFDYNKRFMESMMGLKEKLDLDDAEPPMSPTNRYLLEPLRILRLLTRSCWHFSRIETLVHTFDSHFRQHYDLWNAMDFEAMPPHELMAIYHDMEERLLWNWKTPIINDFYVMIFYGFLKHCCTAWCGDNSGSLQNDLICGEGDIESTRPTKLLMEIAADLRANDERAAFFLAHSADELAVLIPQLEEYRDVAQRVEAYLDLYGFRCINELKLEEPSLRDTPQFLYQMLQNYLRMKDADALDPARMEAREREIRLAAESRAFAALSPIRRPLFKRILRNARRGVRNRENMRFARTRIYGLLRELLNAVGRRFEAEDILDHWHDIYYLTIDEVWDFVKGTAVTTRLRPLAALRKQEFDHYRSEECPPTDDHFESYGLACHRNLFRNWHALDILQQDGDLVGTGCSPGEVTGTVRIVQSPRDDLQLDGQILVAGRTDPGWVPLYPAISGLLIERGSILSHSAIVAREMGIPTIVGIPNLLETLQDGERVTMNGATGTVIRLTATE